MWKETERNATTCGEHPRGEAGFEKPQDCRVIVTLKREGEIAVRLHSKLEHMFGRAMVQCAEDVLKEQEVAHAEVEIFDCGSLDFTIRARVKTALSRARAGQPGNLAKNPENLAECPGNLAGCPGNPDGERGDETRG